MFRFPLFVCCEPTVGFALWLSWGLHKTSYGGNSLFYANNNLTLITFKSSTFLLPPFMFLMLQFISFYMTYPLAIMVAIVIYLFILGFGLVYPYMAQTQDWSKGAWRSSHVTLRCITHPCPQASSPPSLLNRAHPFPAGHHPEASNLLHTVTGQEAWIIVTMRPHTALREVPESPSGLRSHLALSKVIFSILSFNIYTKVKWLIHHHIITLEYSEFVFCF